MTPEGRVRGRARDFVDVDAEAGITFSRADGSALAQAKAANTVGQWILLRELGVDPGDVDRLYLAGGFATYVDVAQRDRDRLPRARAGRPGRRRSATPRCAAPAMLLLSASARAARWTSWSRRIEHVELETDADFFELFVDGCQFKPLPDRLAGSGLRLRS